MEWKTKFHQRINELYERAKDKNYKITQADYANRLGVTRNALMGWLRGSGQPDADGFVRVAQVEEVSLAWLLGDDRIEPSWPEATELTFLQEYRAISKSGKAIVNATLQEIWRQEKIYREK